jgi:Fe2+ transport system protein FeoA
MPKSLAANPRGKTADALGKPARALADVPLGKAATIKAVEGTRVFRRRLLEMGLIPGVEVRVVTIAPLGDPLRIEVRGGQWSIRRNEAAQIEVEQP